MRSPIYQFEQDLSEDGRAWGEFHPGYVLLPTGHVFKRNRKLPVGRWYARIGGHGVKRLVRRDKLNDVALIEAFRWKVWLHHKRRLEEYQTAFEAGRPLERIWHPDEECFHVYSRDGLGREREDVRAPRDSIVDRIARIPTPEQEEAGARLFRAGDALQQAWNRAHFADRVLGYAFALAGPYVDQYEVQPRINAMHVRHHVNGRDYVHYTPPGWGQETMKVWPRPTDDATAKTYYDGFFDCVRCGTRQPASSNTKPLPLRCDACTPGSGSDTRGREQTQAADRR